MGDRCDGIQIWVWRKSICEKAWEVEATLENGESIAVNREPRSTPRRNIGRTLLSGNVFCGHCGGRIFSSTTRRSNHSNVTERVPVYKCYNRTQHKQVCDGQSSYRAYKVDAVIEALLHGIFEKARLVSASEFVEKQVHTTSIQYQQQLKRAKADYTKAAKELEKWESLMLGSIEGTCVFTPEQVKKRLDTVQETIDALAGQIGQLQYKANESQETTAKIMAEHQQLLSWAELFDAASLPEKKMIASQIIKAVTLTRDYGIKVEFNISEAQYLSGMEM